ncbi:MAG: 30S ribosomal protein S16 [Candidatus Moranbacteria bacterium]|nr:30S ribosomal protein S16 [Candidatus Moranbacteria bacterium]
MLTIRFSRVGKKNRAAFRIALQEKAKAPGRKHVEMLGSYDPHSKVAVLKKERILHWISMGAETSESVHNLLVKEGVVEGKKRAIKMEKPAVKEAPVAETPAEVPVAEAAVVPEAPVVAEEVVKAETAPVVEEAKKEEEVKA